MGSFESGERAPFNVSEYLVDRHVDDGRGDAVALRVRGESVTYAELAERVRSLAAGLAALGVRSEERVALILLDGVEFVSTFLAVMRIGAIPLPLNPLLPGRDLAQPAADAWVRVAVVSAQRAGLIADLVEGAPEVRDVVIAGDAADVVPHDVTVHRFDELASCPDEAPAHPTWADSPGFWLCTSGATGRPKLAMHSHGDLRAAAEGYPRDVVGIGAGDRCLSLAPLFGAYGLGNGLAFPLAAGATAILEPTRPPAPSLVARLAREEHPTLLFSVPSSYAALLGAELEPWTFASVRLAASAGERLPAALAERFHERFGIELLDGVASTEMTHVYLSNRPGAVRPGSAGRPVAGHRLRLEDADGRAVATGTPGRLLVSGPAMATGYWCRASATRRSFRGEWFDSGDMYVCSPDGVYTYLGRSDDMFQVAGEWVAPLEVEAVLAEHPAVLEAVVRGEPGAEGLLEPVAYVVPAPCRTLDAADLLEHCRERLVAFKRPRRVVVLPSLPRNDSGEVQRAPQPAPTAAASS